MDIYKFQIVVIVSKFAFHESLRRKSNPLSCCLFNMELEPDGD